MQIMIWSTKSCKACEGLMMYSWKIKSNLFMLIPFGQSILFIHSESLDHDLPLYWRFGITTSERTLQASTQLDKCSANHPPHYRYRTKQLQYQCSWHRKKLHVDVFIFISVVIARQHLLSQFCKQSWILINFTNQIQNSERGGGGNTFKE